MRCGVNSLYRAIALSPIDNVATALSDIPAGEKVEIGSNKMESLVTKEPIPFGFKVALLLIPAGGDIFKYGNVIGYATEEIYPGRLVHTHNVKSRRGRGDVSKGS